MLKSAAALLRRFGQAAGAGQRAPRARFAGSRTPRAQRRAYEGGLLLSRRSRAQMGSWRI